MKWKSSDSSRGYWQFDTKTKQIHPVNEAIWQDISERRIARTLIDNNCYVSTVFLNMDHGWIDDGPPQVFETMVFIDGNDDYQIRCCSYQKALMVHELAVERYRKLRAKSPNASP